MDNHYRIAMVAACPFPSSQGSQVFIKQLSEALMNCGHFVHIVTYHFGENLNVSHLNINRIPTIAHYRKFRAGPSFNKPLLDIFLTLKLLRIVKKYQIDIIHAHNYEASISGCIVRALTGVPVLFHSHGIMGEELHTYFTGKLAQFIARKSSLIIDTVVPAWANHVIALTPEAQSFFMAHGVPKGKIDHIPPGIYYDGCVQNGSSDLRSAYNIGTGPLILYTGNLDRYQNIDLLLKSFKLVVNEYPDARLMILTHCNSEKYVNLCGDAGISHQVVFVKDPSFAQVKSFLAEARVAVVSRVASTGFPIKLLNYMAAGKAIVVFEGAAQNIEHLKDGFVAQNGDIESFSEGIKALINNRTLCELLGKNAKNKVALLYDWNHITRRITQVYEKLHMN